VRVEAIYLSPVKSLGLQRVENARVGEAGFAGDRLFFVVDERGRLCTQRQCGALVRVAAAWDEASDRLRLRFPDGAEVEGSAAGGDPIVTRFFGTDLSANLVDGPFAAALSAFAGQPLRLVRAKPGTAFDDHPVSLCSEASVAALATAARAGDLDERRFRPNIYVSGVDAHGEDGWIGAAVAVGDDVVLHVAMRDARCVITTHNPATGEPDIDTLNVIAAYRTDQPKQANFGVYATVERSGVVSVGDTITVLDRITS
jgi:uncharacterized protein YcbX